MSCPSPAAAIDICPTTDEVVAQLLPLLPRGRAWGTHDGGPQPASVLYRFWYAVADVLSWLNGRICDLAKEFFCATIVETRDWWMAEYGLPDACDPFPDLCAKVAALGGTTCAYYRAVAAQAGWAIDCVDAEDACGFQADCAQADCQFLGDGLAAGALYIEVDLGASPAYVAGVGPAVADCFFADQVLGCQPDLSGIECLITRIVGAHMQVIYGTVTSDAGDVFVADDIGEIVADDSDTAVIQ